MYFRKITFINLMVVVFVISVESARDVVLVHGLLSNTDELSSLENYVRKTLPHVNVTEIKLLYHGKSFMPLWHQVRVFGEQLRAISKDDKNGINLVCFSQGALICRGIIESVKDHNVHTFISLAGPQMGEFGVPSFLPQTWIFNTIKDMVQWVAYSALGQLLSVGGYWRDPHHLKEYKERSEFLPVLNNEVPHINDKEFKKNFLKLKRLVLCGGPDDGIVKPWESSIFGFYNADNKYVQMKEQEIYRKDTFGLKTLDKRKAITLIVVPKISHYDWKIDYQLFTNFLLPWLK